MAVAVGVSRHIYLNRSAYKYSWCFCVAIPHFKYFLITGKCSHFLVIQIFLEICFTKFFETNLLCRLQAQTLSDEAPPIGKILPFSKMAATFEPLIGF